MLRNSHLIVTATLRDGIEVDSCFINSKPGVTVKSSQTFLGPVQYISNPLGFQKNLKSCEVTVLHCSNGSVYVIIYI